jgi:hypothetical protein
VRPRYSLANVLHRLGDALPEAVRHAIFMWFVVQNISFHARKEMAGAEQKKIRLTRANLVSLAAGFIGTHA